MRRALPQDAIALLRDQIARVESGLPARPGTARFSLGHAGIDAVLGGGMQRRAMHEILPATPLDQAAASAFAFCLAVKSQAKSIIWIGTDRMQSEAGAPFAPGLAALGLDPARLVFVHVTTVTELLWAAEEALRAPSVGLTLIEAWNSLKTLELSAARRLVLAVGTGGGAGIFLRDSNGLPHPFTSRWVIAAAPSPAEPGGVPGRTCFDLDLVRNRLGPLGRWRLVWNHDVRSFTDAGILSPPLSQPLVSAPGRRPYPSEISGDSGAGPVPLRTTG